MADASPFMVRWQKSRTKDNRDMAIEDHIVDREFLMQSCTSNLTYLVIDFDA